MDKENLSSASLESEEMIENDESQPTNKLNTEIGNKQSKILQSRDHGQVEENVNISNEY